MPQVSNTSWILSSLSMLAILLTVILLSNFGFFLLMNGIKSEKHFCFKQIMQLK